MSVVSRRPRRRRRGRRVLIIVENLPVPFDRRVWQEATTLRDAGYQVSVISVAGPDYPPGHTVIDGIHVYRHPLPVEARRWYGFAVEYAAALFFEFVLVVRVFATRGFDVIHACNPPDTIFLIGGLFKLLFGTKFLFDHHDLSPELYTAKGGRPGSLFDRLLRQLERWTFQVADVSIATNESYRQIAIERGGMDPARVFVVRSGPDLRRLQPGPPVPELKRGRPFLVGYVGVMGKQEGLQYLLEAVRYIVHDCGRHAIQFGLVGGGPELERLRRLARDLQIDDYVTFTGRVSDAEMLAMLNTADVCVNPDEFNEMNDKSTMNKVLEYMALGKSMVQFDLTEGRVSANGASLYARRNDPIDLALNILALIDDESLRQRMGYMGRERIEKELSWNHQTPQLLAVYDAILGPR